MLVHWQADSDLTGIRDLNALEQFSTNERKECLSMERGQRSAQRQLDAVGTHPFSSLQP
jgi:hypothetical protein